MAYSGDSLRSSLNRGKTLQCPELVSQNHLSDDDIRPIGGGRDSPKMFLGFLGLGQHLSLHLGQNSIVT